MLGSPTARHLADAGCDVVLIGQLEPTDYRNHTGVFASHHDIARVSRTIDPDPVRSWLAHRSVEQFDEVASRTGIRAVNGVGHLWVDASQVIDLLAVADERFGLGCLRRSATDTVGSMPYLSLPDGLDTLYEPSPAGYVDPRAHVRAEVLAAADAGATVVDALVGSVVGSGHAVEVGTDLGTVTADRVLLATGAFSGHGDTPVAGLDLEYALHTQLYVELPDDEADRLSGMPSIIAKFPDPLDDLYLTPPVVDPQGRTVFKIGTPQDNHVRVASDRLTAWFRTDGDPVVADRLEGILAGLIPTSPTSPGGRARASPPTRPAATRPSTGSTPVPGGSRVASGATATPPSAHRPSASWLQGCCSTNRGQQRSTGACSGRRLPVESP